MAATEHSFDLFGRRPGWKAEEVLVLTPYVEASFFTQLAHSLKPKRLSVVIDDGCRPDDIEMVTKAISAAGGRAAKGLRCVLGSAPGLMHLKLFYIMWRTPGKQIARTLIFGSANATRQGFGGAINAELIASLKLTVTKHADIIAWCDAALAAVRADHPTRIEAARNLDIGKGARLRLPALTIGKRKPETASFDLWLQRGWLLSQYRPDPSFLRIPIHLAKGLSQTAQAEVAASSGFFVPATKRLNFPYAVPPGQIGADDDDCDGEDDGETANWRRKYFTWTQLGDWCSEACYDAENQQFRRKGFELRAQRIARLETLRSPDALTAERIRFLNALAKLWDDFGDEARELLKGDARLDEAYYTQLFDQRLERDLALIRDREFIERYLRGFELSPIPRFRSDVRGWVDFVDSFARQLCLDNMRTRNQSRLLAAVRYAIDETGEGRDLLDEPERLRDAMRELFRRTDHGGATVTDAVGAIVRYHDS